MSTPKKTFTYTELGSLAETMFEVTSCIPIGNELGGRFWNACEGARKTVSEDILDLALATEDVIERANPFDSGDGTHDYWLFTEALAGLYVRHVTDEARGPGLHAGEAEDLVIRALNAPGVAYAAAEED